MATQFNPELTVLIVEDNDLNAEIVLTQLHSFGISNCFVACNGQIALESLTQIQFDLIIMDFEMPVMDGVTATSKIRSEGFDMPIIGLTASSQTESEKQGQTAGMNEVLFKPSNIDDLVSTIRGCLADQNLGLGTVKYT